MTASPARRLLDHLRSRQEGMVDLLTRLARAESPSHDPAAQEPVFALLAEALAGAGYRARRRHGRASGGQLLALPAGRGRGHPAQLLLGHADTVWPHGTLAQMPVEVRGEDGGGRLAGPGVFDMKGGLVQAVFALRALAELGLEPPASPVLFVNSDEEIGSGESTAAIRRLARAARRVFVLEPALGPEGKVKTERKGCWQFDIAVHGRAAHAGLAPETGASAIREMAHVIQSLDALADPARGITVNVGVVSGGTRRNVVAAEAHAQVEVRVRTIEDGRAVERAVLALVPATPGTRLAVTGGVDRPPLERTPRNRALFAAARAAAAELGIELGEGFAGGGSDGSTTSLYAPTLDGLGAVGDGAHAVDEHVRVERMPERAALLALLLLSPLPQTAA
jgi:glutamate carboxypeptidase